MDILNCDTDKITGIYRLVSGIAGKNALVTSREHKEKKGLYLFNCDTHITSIQRLAGVKYLVWFVG